MLKKTSSPRGATRQITNNSRARLKGLGAGQLQEGNRRYAAYGVACLLCVGAGAYIGHSSQTDEPVNEQLADNANKNQSTDALQIKPLEIKYAYFGAAAVHMPSEKNSDPIQTTVARAENAAPARTLTPTASTSQQTTTSPLTSKQPSKPEARPAPDLTQTEEHANKPHADGIATVAKGDTFSTIGQGFGLSARETANIMSDSLASQHLSTIIPGEQINFERGRDGKVTQIVYVIDDAKTLVLDRTGGANFSASVDEVALEKRTLVNMGIVENSLFLSAAKAGVSNRHIMQMVEIFRWDIDFAMDVQPGDAFKLVYEGFYKNEQLVRTGKLLGAEFKGRSTHQALYFTDQDGEGGYYTPRGRQLEKQFLRNPVDTVRITSPFNPRRKHPVLNTIKAHKGVDYGAPIGTPIKATADGTVKYSGRRGTYGMTVELQHGKRYTTLYAHMNKIHPSAQVGKRVKQGQVIGYVGKTGRVTGAHLHYEFRVKGVHVNPQTVKFAGAGTVSDSQMRVFKTATGPIMQKLTSLNPNRIALSE